MTLGRPGYRQAAGRPVILAGLRDRWTSGTAAAAESSAGQRARLKGPSISYVEGPFLLRPTVRLPSAPVTAGHPVAGRHPGSRAGTPGHERAPRVTSGHPVRRAGTPVTAGPPGHGRAPPVAGRHLVTSGHPGHGPASRHSRAPGDDRTGLGIGHPGDNRALS